MDTKINKEKLIDYLYGELSPKEEALVKAALQKDPALAAALMSLKETREHLGNIQDEPVNTPVLMMGGSTMTVSSAPFVKSSFTKKLMAVAAVMILFLLAARIMGLNIRYDNQSVILAFGNTQQPGKYDHVLNNPEDQKQINMITSTQQQLEMVSGSTASLKENNMLLSDRLQNLEKHFMELSENLTLHANKNQKNILSDEELKALASQISAQNMELLTSMVTASNASQEQYIKTLFADFAEYLHSRRVEDLRNIQISLTQLKQESTIKNLQTEEVIARLIQTINDKDN